MQLSEGRPRPSFNTIHPPQENPEMLFAQLEYSMDVAAMSEDQHAALLAFWPGCARMIEQRQKAYSGDMAKVWALARYEFGGTQRITLEEAHGLEVAGIKLSLESVDGTMLTKMSHRADKYGSITPMEMRSGQVVQIAVPDIGIMAINEVDWLEDACTQDLQARLDEGWRILAVCPPNAQRRPDYILGRSTTSRAK